MHAPEIPDIENSVPQKKNNPFHSEKKYVINTRPNLEHSECVNPKPWVRIWGEMVSEGFRKRGKSRNRSNFFQKKTN